MNIENYISDESIENFASLCIKFLQNPENPTVERANVIFKVAMEIVIPEATEAQREEIILRVNERLKNNIVSRIALN